MKLILEPQKPLLQIIFEVHAVASPRGGCVHLYGHLSGGEVEFAERWMGPHKNREVLRESLKRVGLPSSVADIAKSEGMTVTYEQLQELGMARIEVYSR